jgi:hypothetical protein
LTRQSGIGRIFLYWCSKEFEMPKSFLLAFVFAFGLVPALSFAQSASIPNLNDFRLTVGQSVVFYGFVGECGVAPTRVQLPQLRTGTLSVGRVGARNSRRCGGMTPAVEIIFTATQPGTEGFRINEDRFIARVRN